MKSANTISIAVLPFEDLSIHKDTTIFCKSFCIDLITELSFFKQFNIIAYQTAQFIQSSSALQDLNVGEWDIDYYIQGSYRGGEDNIRVNAQLFQTETNRLVWANRFEGALDELIDLQDSLLQEIVAALQVHINEDLLSRQKVKPRVKLKAYEYWLYGMDAVKRGTPQGDLEARSYFQKALEIEPEYSLAYSGMSLTYFNEWSCQLWERWEVSQNGAFEWAKKAIQFDESNYIASFILGRVFLYQGTYETAEYYLRRSLQLNANDPEVLINIAYCFTYLDHKEEARQLYHRAVKLNPVKAENYASIGAFIYFESGQFDQARTLAEKAITKRWVDTDAFYAGIFYHLGELDKMQAYWMSFLSCFKEQIMKGQETTQIQAIKWFKQANPYRNESRMDPFLAFIAGEESPSVEPKVQLRNKKDKKNAFIFRKDGELWEYQFAGQGGFIAEVKGFYDIQKLISSPGAEIHCSELMDPVLQQQGEALADEQAKNEYLKQLKTIQAELAEAEERTDYERIEALQKKYDELISFLSKTFDKKGRIRKKGGTVNKIRSAVTWRIRSAISKIEEVHPAMGKHLNNAIKTGSYCQYLPESEINWDT